MTELDGVTEVAGAGATEVDDATVVRPRGEDSAEADDATVVRPRRELREAREAAAADVPGTGGDDVGAAVDDAVDDATVVRPHRKAPDEVDDATIVRPRRRDAEEHSTGGSVALPVEEPEVSGRSFGTGSTPGLDPERRISAVPDRAPWETGPVAERGVRPGAPVVYGARSEYAGGAQPGADEIHRRLGDPPPATFVPVREGRSALPSVGRRTARARIGTLIGYAAVAVVAVLGLWGVAVLAFG